ncbi:MAG: UDP-3-O-acyl-N-acetylglucosamine deacetylase [Pseudomonadales bacterium]|nr:UDP-3-O-acyl-N-acetylglucosamine deacetylase [Pseudomonadales bacterium]MCP5185347.1 UDP-3-O-acyl-N-acetylglucosamine deacetylase [Pseudomonadales bacterium]
MPANQHTLKNPIHATGTGLHTGEAVRVTFRPAPVDTGILFVRTDLAPEVVIPARIDYAGESRLATRLEKGPVSIMTVEHLLSALAGMAIDNLLVEVHGPELPIMDGSANPFVFLLQAAGVEAQSAARRYLRVCRKVVLSEGDAEVSLSPHDGFRLEYTFVHDHPLIQHLIASSAVDLTTMSYIKEVARARTFGFLADYEAMLGMNLAKGGSLSNAVLVDDQGVVNEDGLRGRDEFVKHKILDAIGDLYLLGAPLLGVFRGVKSGHAMNRRLMQRLLDSPNAFEMVTFAAGDDVPGAIKNVDRQAVAI